MVVGHSISDKSSRDTIAQVSWESLGCPERRHNCLLSKSMKSYRFLFLTTPVQWRVWVRKRTWQSTALCHHRWSCPYWHSPSQQCQDQGCHNHMGVQPTGGLTLCARVKSCKIWPSEDKELWCRRLLMPSWLSPQRFQSTSSQFSPNAFKNEQPFKKQPLKYNRRCLWIT